MQEQCGSNIAVGNWIEWNNVAVQNKASILHTVYRNGKEEPIS